MLRLLHKSVRNRRALWLKIGGYSTAIHGILLCVIFLCYKGNNTLNFSISSRIIPQGVPVVLVPHIKRLGNPIPRISSGNDHQKGSAPAAAQPVAQQPLKSKTNAARASTSLASQSPAAIRKKNVLPIKKAPAKKAQKKASNGSKTMPAKKAVPALKQDLKKKNDSLKVKKEIHAKEAKPSEKIMAPIEKIAVQDSLSVPSDSLASDQASQITGDKQELFYVGREEWEQMQRQTELQENMAHAWQPPAGLADDLSCEIQVLFDVHGAIKNIIIQKASGSSMFDMSARQAIYSLKTPQWAYGKEVMIAFSS